MATLVEQRVQTLVVMDGAEAPGTKCVTCGWLGTAGHSSCPVDETTLDRVDNIIEPAIQAAIRQAAGVHVLRPADGPEAPTVPAPFDGPVAAVLRFESRRARAALRCHSGFRAQPPAGARFH